MGAAGTCGNTVDL